MTAKIGRWLSVLLLCLPAAAFADARVELTVDRAQVAVEDELVAQVTVHGAQRAAEPKVEGFSAFDVEPAGTSSQVQFINGTTSLSVVFNYRLVPKSIGSFTLGPAEVTIQGQVVRSSSVKVTISKSPVAQAPDRPFQLLAKVEPPEAFVNQQVTYTFQLWAKASLHNAQLNFPDFGGFLKEELGKQRQYETVKDGSRWTVTEMKVALFPTRAGDLSIGSAQLTGQSADGGGIRGTSPFDDLFDRGSFFGLGGRMKTVHLRSPGLLVKVKPLPPGRTAGFSGFVGVLTVQSRASASEVAVGDSVTWTVEVSGRGNVRDLTWQSPAPSGFKLYDDQPQYQAGTLAGAIGGTKTFKKALVPLEPGALTIPSVSVPYFDPEHGGWRTASAPALSLKITGQAAVAGSLPSAKAVRVAGEDLIAPRWTELDSTEGPTPAERARYAALFASAPGLLLAAWLAGAAKRRRRDAEPLLRRHRAARAFKTRARRWNGAVSFEDLSGALRQYLGERFGADPGSLTAADVKRLEAEGLPPILVGEVEALLDLCEQGRYGGIGDSQSVRERVSRLVDGIEREIRT